MTLDQAKKMLANAKTDRERADWAAIVAVKEQRIATEGGDGEGKKIKIANKMTGVNFGNNPYED